MSEKEDSQRFLDPGKTLYDLMDEILVECPRCSACARIAVLQPGRRDWFAPRRLTCLHCGYTRDWAEREIRQGSYHNPALDDFFHERLWLQITCGSELLWAYNFKHLKLIEDYVSAQLREHRELPDFGWQNSSLLNRLPRWISAAKNRYMVLKAIQKLKTK